MEFSDPDISAYDLADYVNVALTLDQYDDVYITCGSVRQYTGMSLNSDSPSVLDDWQELTIIELPTPQPSTSEKLAVRSYGFGGIVVLKDTGEIPIFNYTTEPMVIVCTSKGATLAERKFKAFLASGWQQPIEQFGSSTTGNNVITPGGAETDTFAAQSQGESFNVAAGLSDLIITDYA